MKKYVANIEVRKYEDSYEDGEKDFIGSANYENYSNDLTDLIENLISEIRAKKEDCHFANINNYEWGTELWYDSKIEDMDDNQLNDAEMEKWKKGEVKGYIRRYHIIISYIEYKELTLPEMKLTEIDIQN